MGDYFQRIKDIILATPISEISSEFILAVILHMKDGTVKIMTNEEYDDFAENLDDENLLDDLGVEEMTCQLDMEFLVEFIHHHVDEVMEDIFKK